MAIFCVTYEYGDDQDTLATVRPVHRDWLADLPSLLASGPTDANGAVLIVEGESAAQVEKLMDGDPLAAAGVISHRRVVGWDVVRGRWLKLINQVS
jgi:uncharacterized protein